MEDYNFPVELQPIYLANSELITNKKAVVRTDTNTPLGIVGADYGLIKHSTVVDAFRIAKDLYGAKEEIILAKNGALLFYKMTFPKIQSEVAKGDIVQMQMIAKNSYNGSNALQVIFGALRLVCLNGMVLGKQFLSFNYRHTAQMGGLNGELIIDKFKKSYNSYMQIFGEKMPMITEMSKLPMFLQEDSFNQKRVDIPKYLLAEAKTSFESGEDKTVWGYYNALTFAITHKSKKENPDLAIKYGIEAWRVAEEHING